MTRKSNKTTTRLSSKGQIVLPKEVRDKHGLEVGAVVEVYSVPEGIMLRVAEAPAEASLEQLLGCTGYRGPRKTLQDMEAAIREGARARR